MGSDGAVGTGGRQWAAGVHAAGHAVLELRALAAGARLGGRRARNSKMTYTFLSTLLEPFYG